MTNGSFEFFNVPDDGVYLIKNVQDWSRSGDSSGASSGIISTATKDWDAITASDLADKLDKNNDLSHSDKDYVDYNGMKSGDIPYRDTYAAKLETSAVKDDKIIHKNDLSYAEFLGITVTKGEDDNPDTYTYGEGDDEVAVYFNEDDGDFYFDTDYTKPVRKDVIKNPETYHGSYRYDEASGKHYLGEGDNEVEIYLDDDGNYYKDEKKEYSEGNVLMIHNYPTDTKYNGIQQYYSSSTITLEARTAAKISVWVKTSDLKFDKGYSLLDEQDRGAYIEVVQTVGGTTIDAFSIKAINTEKIIADDNGVTGSNGWLQYNIYVNACDFASSTVQVRLGLGKPNGETCTGYAFFDDVTVEKALDLNDEALGYTEVANEILNTNKTYCTLASTDDDKVFYADKAVRESDDERHSTHFNYLIDLASKSGAAEGEDGYQTVVWDKDTNLATGLTTEEEDGKTYASAKNYGGKYPNLNKPTEPDNGYDLYKKTAARPTDSDLLGLFSSDANFNDTGIDSKYVTALKDALLGEKTSFAKLPTYEEAKSKMLVMLSVWGAAYTTTISDESFKVKADDQLIVSFWVKTSDMNGKTAATIKIYDKDDKDNSQELTLDTSDITTDIGDDKDIYNGWVQCFFFVKNETKNEKTFQIDFCFGNTSIISASSYNPGWVALANMQTLKVSEEVYNLNAGASYNQKFKFENDTEEKDHNKFADALGTYDITDEISAPDGYNGVNGGSTSVAPDADYNHNFDIWNTNHEAGLINKDTFNDTTNKKYEYWQSILAKFTSDISATKNWEDVFGKDCYQPLIIVNNLRRYAENAHINKETFDSRKERNETYYVLDEDGNIEDNAGRKYRKVDDQEEYNEDEHYYTINEVVNYGFVGSDKTISSGSTQTISVRVMVSGNATAYIYLVDATTREVMSYSIPGYTFWYDVDGNVIDEEYDEEWEKKDGEREKHIVYELQDNGLYKDDNGDYFANTHNLKKIYYKKDGAHYWYYDEKGEITEYKGKKLEKGVDYYADEEASLPSPYRLCNSDDQPIFQYKDGTDGNETYYYIVNGKATDTVVKPFDTEYARYNYNAEDENGISLSDTEYCVAVGNTDGEWVTVNFVVKAGSEAKSYRLELWSGERNGTGVKEDSTYDEGAIAFDYSAYSITSSNFSTVTEYYQSEIISKYQQLLIKENHADKIDFDTTTIKDYEDLIKELGLEENEEFKTIKKSYTAHYYTYSLYDSESFIPVNKDAGDANYSYTAPDSETLAFFRNENKDSAGKTVAYNVFIDYSAVEQTVSRESSSDNNNSGNDSSNGTANAGDFWLQLASIILVAVLLFVLLALVARMVIKKVRRNKKLKDQSKNVYRKRERYLRKLHIEAEETEEVDNPALQNTEAEEVTEETPVEETPSTEEVKEEAPAEEAPAETPVEEAPAETTETPSENPEDKPE